MSCTFRTAMLLVTLLAGCKTRQADPAASRPAEARRSAPGAAPALPDPSAPSGPASADPAQAEAQAQAQNAAQARNIAALQHLADTLGDDARDCDKLAVDLKAFIAGNRALLAELMAAANRPSDDLPSGANHAAAAAAARKLQAAMASCVATSSVAAAMKDLPGPGAAP